MQNNEWENGAVAPSVERYREMHTASLYAESGCEYILPDYMGEIKKLLLFGAKPIPAGKYESERGGSYSGVVEYKVIYYDSEGRLNCAEFTSDYDFEAKSPLPVTDSYVKTSAASTGVRLLGPRKLSVKCALSSEVFMNSVDGVPIFEGSEDYECRSENIRVKRAHYLKSREREYAEEGELLSGIGSEDAEIVANGTDVIVNGVRFEGGEIAVSGEICAYAIIRISDGDTVRCVCKIPFEEQIDAGGIATAEHVSVDAYITSLHSSINDKTDDEGDPIGSAAVFGVTLELYAKIDTSEEISITTDVYSTKGECEPERTVYEYKEPVGYGIKREKIAFTLDPSAIDGQARSVLTATASARGVSSSTVPSGIKISGECECAAVVCVSGAEPYATVRGSCPFEFTVPISELCEGVLYDTVEFVGISDVKYSLAGGGIEVEAYVDTDVSVARPRSISAVSSAKLIGESFTEESKITVFYPDKNESLFDICKRFGVKISSVASENSLSKEAASNPYSKDSIEGVDFLVISEI